MWKTRADIAEGLDDEHCLPIELTNEPYNGTIISYGKLEIEEPEDDAEDAILHFDVTFHENPHNASVDDKNFVAYAGEVLVQIIEQAVSEEEMNEDRGDNTSESVE